MAISKTFKDDIFTGNRKYNLIENADDTISLVDVTEYSESGSTIDAALFTEIVDGINGNETSIESVKSGKANDATLTATSWQADEDEYKYELSLSWVTSSDVLAVDIVPSSDSETRETELSAWASVYDIQTGSGKVVFKSTELIEVDINITYVLVGVKNG